ncbi:MAG: hypothetical protein R2764_17385 [Bacteroidales bacterium]
MPLYGKFDGVTEVSCNRYVDWEASLYIWASNLVIGDWYYISVDNWGFGHRGTFSLCVDNVIDYDFYEGAITVPHTSDWCSLDAEYTTIGATPDLNAASCWNTNPNYNRWFKFQATTPEVTVTVKRGGALGTIRRINAAIWEVTALQKWRAIAMLAIMIMYL